MLKYIEMTPKTSPFLWWPEQLYTKKTANPQYIHFSEEHPQKYWNSKFWLQKLVRAYVRMKISE